MTRVNTIVAACIFLSGPLCCAQVDAGEESAAQPVSFQRDIRPIFQTHCHGCHQPAKSMGDYVMTNHDSLMQPGETGDAVIVPGKPDESYLVSQITPEDGVAEMPKNGKPLAESEVALIRRWIEQSATDDSPPEKNQYDAEHPPRYSRPPVITALDFAPDGKSLAVAGFHEVVIHALDDIHAATASSEATQPSAPLARLIGMSERIESIRYSPDGKRLAVTGGKPAEMGEVQIWDTKTNELTLSMPVTFDTVYGASWSPDSKFLAFGCADNTVRVIEASTGKQVLFQSAHSDWALDTVFSVDGSHLATVGRDATAKLVEVATQRFVDNITSITPGALRGGIHSISRHPTRDEILIGGADGVPKVYRMHRQTKRVIGDDANLLWELPPLVGRIFSVDYSSDGKRIAAGSSLDGVGAVHVYGIEADPKLPDEIKSLLFKPTHQRTDDERKKLQQHFDTGIKTLAAIPIASGGIYAVSIHPDSAQVAAAGTDGQIRIIDIADGKIALEFPAVQIEGETESQSDSHDTSRVAARPLEADTTAADPTDGGEREGLLPNAKIARLIIEPPEVTLSSPVEYAQLVVSAELETGDIVDVTRMAKLSSRGGASVSPYGRITAEMDGDSTITASLGGQTTTTLVKATGVTGGLHPDYIQDISPVLARAGCNAGTCHGAQDGKNGFKLSLRGYDPIFDVRALTDDLESRRTNLAAPRSSLFLQKPTGAVAHEGGVVLKPDGDYYRTLLAWVNSGAALNLKSPKVTAIEVQPVNPVVQQIGTRTQLRVVATFADGKQRDVTREAFVESGNSEVAKPVPDYPGLIEVIRRGEAPLLVRYEGAYAATTITAIGNRDGFTWIEPPANSPIDEMVHAKLVRTKTATAGLCNDYTFLRRVYLDLTGLPPTPAQVAEFIDDAHDSRWKRNTLINALVGNSEYIEHWTNKWADLLQVNGKFLGREGATAFRGWIREHVKTNTPYDQFAREILTANGSNRENPAAAYYKILREPEATMENTTQLFLATRFNCNKCHDHPFERWTQDQYYQLSAYFARVGLKADPESGDKKIGGTAVESATPLYEIVFTKDEGEVKHLRTTLTAEPEFPFPCDHETKSDAPRRDQLAAWISSENNRYFAMSYANRIWAYLTGRGLIEPIDDIRAGNPPTNPELLEWLTQQFIGSGFDTQHLVRIICQSRTYQLAIETNAFNEDDDINYSHARTRRLPAEVLYDAIYRTTGAKSAFQDMPGDMRAAALPDVGIELPDGFLNNLGRPPRESACECERSSDLQMGPVMALINGATVGDALAQSKTAIARIVANQPDDRQMARKLFLRILSRPADESEIDAAMELIHDVDQNKEAVVRDLADYQIELAPLLMARELQRLDSLKAKQTELANLVAKIAPNRARLAKERRERIAEARESDSAVRKKVLLGLAEWETQSKKNTVWETLNPIVITSSYGEMHEVEEDGSIFATGKLAKGRNTIIAPTKVAGITGLRVEALTDDRLPKKGPGRADDGNFVLTEIKLWAASLAAQPATVLQTWELSETTEGWTAEGDTTIRLTQGTMIVGIDRQAQSKRLAVAVDAPGKPLALDVTVRLESAADMMVEWLTEDETVYDVETRGVQQRVTPGTAAWRTYRLYFQPKSSITRLRLGIHGGGLDNAIDSIRLVAVDPPEMIAAKLHNPKADHSQSDYDVAEAVDGETQGVGNGWAVAPQTSQSHIAIFEIDGKLDVSHDGLVKIKMVQNYRSKKHALGRFRLSVTRSPIPLKLGLPESITKVLAMDSTDRTEEQRSHIEEHYLALNEDWKKSQAAIREAEKAVPPDPQEVERKRRITELEKPLPPDAKLVRLQRAVKLSEQQYQNKRFTAAQDIAWALINSPEFLYNH